MFSFYCNRNCVNVHWEIQSNKGWTFFCHITLGPFLMGWLPTYIENCFFHAFFSESSQRSGILNSWLWMATDVYTPAARIFPSCWDSQVHFNVWKMSKKDWITSLMLDAPPMLPKKSGFYCLKKSLATRKTHKEPQKENHWGKEGL